MSFSPKVWHDWPLTDTPVSAAGITDLETRLSGYTDARVPNSAGSYRQNLVRKGAAKALPVTSSGSYALPESCVFDAVTQRYYLIIGSGGTWYATAPAGADLAAPANWTDQGAFPVGAGGDGGYLFSDGTAWWFACGQSASTTSLSLYKYTGTRAAFPGTSGNWTTVSTLLIPLGTIASILPPAGLTTTPGAANSGSLPAATYYYSVTARTASGGETQATAPVSGVAAANGSMALNWTASAGETNGYDIFRSASNSQYLPGQLIGTVATGVTTFTDTGAVAPNPLRQAPNPITTFPTGGTSSSFDHDRITEPCFFRMPPNAQGYTWGCIYMGFDQGSIHEQVGIAFSTGDPSGPWVKGNNGNPIIPTGGGWAQDATVAADPYAVWINGQLCVFYVVGEMLAVTFGIGYQVALAATPDPINGPWTKYGVVLHSPSWPLLQSGQQNNWSGGTITNGNGDEGRYWRGGIFFDSVSDRVFIFTAGSAIRTSAAGSTGRCYVAEIDSRSPLFRVGPLKSRWQRVEVESGDSRWSSSGSWAVNVSDNAASAGQIQFSGNTNDQQTFSFEGTDIRVGLVGKANYGISAIYLDGVLQGYLDHYFPDGTTNLNRFCWEANNLTPGLHQVQVVVTGNKNASSSGANVGIDYAEYIPVAHSTPF